MHESSENTVSSQPEIIKSFSVKSEFESLCREIAQKETKFQAVIEQYGFPVIWFRKPEFATLILTILEQQVSLASANAAFQRLNNKIEEVTPQNFILLTDNELKECYFSRQKIIYARNLAREILEGRLDLDDLNKKTAEQIRDRLIQLKGIGNWTIDMYLLMSLHHPDIFPAGDLATIKSVYELQLVPENSTKEEITEYMKIFMPWRSVATYLLWHSYLGKRKNPLLNSENMTMY